MFKLKINKGFTLVELLIVISIIGVLATLLMANFIGVRQRARDAQRKSDLRQIQAALEMYRADNGRYPTVGDAVYPYPNGCGSGISLLFGTVTYMSTIPCDPINTGQNLYTFTTLTPTNYTIHACLENINDAQGVSGSCTNGKDYSVINP